mgnify:CR=1 FL=1
MTAASAGWHKRTPFYHGRAGEPYISVVAHRTGSTQQPCRTRLKLGNCLTVPPASYRIPNTKTRSPSRDPQLLCCYRAIPKAEHQAILPAILRAAEPMPDAFTQEVSMS